MKEHSYYVMVMFVDRASAIQTFAYKELADEEFNKLTDSLQLNSFITVTNDNGDTVFAHKDKVLYITKGEVPEKSEEKQ